MSRALATLPPVRFVVGLEVAPRGDHLVPTIAYDGRRIPFASRSFGTVVCVDTLHHATSPADVLREASRVSQGSVLVKDHFCENVLDLVRLTFLDLAGNLPHLNSLSVRYFTRRHWADLVRAIGLEERYRVEEVAGMYPQPFQRILGRRIQFVSLLAQAKPQGLVDDD